MGQSPVVTVGAKRTMEYVLGCLSLFNRGAEELDLVSVGDCISKAAEVYRILSTSFGTSLEAADITPLHSGEAVFARSSFHLRRAASAGVDLQPWSTGDSQFVSFPVYQLLLDHLLATQGQIVIGASQGRSLLRITSTDGGFVCRGGEDLDITLDGTRQDEKKKSPRELVTEAMARTGFLLSDRWREVAGRLGQFDDIVLGLDTNILYGCVITQQILDSLVFTCHSNASPNWILLVVPSTVMHELEQAANGRDEKGELSLSGRMGYRALQEILELDLAKDIRGVSLLIAGETDPILDARVELRALRGDVQRTAPQGTRFLPRNSFGDTLIRDQFKGFLRQLSYHKGAFFLTADKSNSALGQAEGLHSLYVPPPNGRRAISSGVDLAPPPVRFDEQNISMNVPIGKIVYEMAVQFGSIFLSGNGTSIKVGCDARGDSLEHWLKRELIIDQLDVRKLLAHYPQSERVSLEQAEATWDTENKMAMSW
jgi:DNA-binding protein